MCVCVCVRACVRACVRVPSKEIGWEERLYYLFYVEWDVKSERSRSAMKCHLQVLKKSFNQAVGKLSNRMKMPPRQDTGRFLGDGLDSDWDSASLRSGLSDDEDDTVSLLHQLEGQLEAPAFDHRIPYSDDVSIAASDTRDEDHDIVGEVSDRMIGLCPPPAGHPRDCHWCDLANPNLDSGRIQ